MRTWKLAVASALLLVPVLPCSAVVSARKVATGAYPELTVDRAGDAHLVYVRDGLLRYQRRDIQTGAWSPEESTNLPARGAERSDPEVAVDSHGRPHVLVGSAYAWRDGDQWRAIDPGVKRDTALAIDSRDNVYVVRRGGHHGGHVGLRVRAADTDKFVPLPDPDTADGLPLGRNDHVYAHLAIDRRDDSLHIVYRHGAPRKCAYRVSRDGGRTWSGGGICDDDREAPSIAIGPQGAVFAVTGTGQLFEQGEAGAWQSHGRALSAGSRDLPVVAAAAGGRVIVGSFGGRFNVCAQRQIAQEQLLSAPRGKKLGFVALAVARQANTASVAWEEGDAVDNDGLAGESDILFAEVEFTDNQSATGQTKAIATPDDSADRSARDTRETVDLYGRFEKAFANDKRYADPYRDVMLNIKLRRPDGGETVWWGFYDGNETWRFRYAPDQVGVWSYEASFSDGQPAASGGFECVRGNHRAGIDIYRQNPVWFGDRAGRPLLVRGLHIGDRFFAANWPDDERRQFLDWVQANKYNLLSIASHFLNRGAPGRGQSWQTPKLWPLDAAEYRRMESILDDLARRGIAVFPFAGFFGQKSNYPRDEADQERYVRYTLARLAPYENMLWNVAGPEPNLRDSWMAAEDVERLGRLIKSLDPLAHPISVHNRTGDDPYRDSDWTTYGVLQGPKSLDRTALSRGLLKNHHPAKPLLAQETLWSGNVNHIRQFGGRDYSDDDIRKNAYVIHMSAAALVFADNDGDSSTGFSGTLALADCRQNRHDILRGVWDCLEDLGTHRMKPRQDLVSRGYCLAEPGESYLVYLESPQSVDVKLEGGRYRATWINAKNPTERKEGGMTMDGKALSPPPGGDDWLVRLTRERE